MAAVADENSYGHNMTIWEIYFDDLERQRQEELDQAREEWVQEAWAEHLRNGPDQPEEEIDWDATSDDDMDVDIIVSNK